MPDVFASLQGGEQMIHHWLSPQLFESGRFLRLMLCHVCSYLLDNFPGTRFRVLFATGGKCKMGDQKMARVKVKTRCDS
jgi:hypothetical protein